MIDDDPIWEEIKMASKDIKDYEKVMVVFHMRRIDDDTDEFPIAVFPCWDGNPHEDDICVGYWGGIDALGPHSIRVDKRARIATSTERYKLMRYLKKEQGLNLAIRERAPSLAERKRWVSKGYG